MSPGIGRPARKTDFEPKADGSIRYCCDVTMEGMLYARTKRSEIPSGIIESIEMPHLPDGYFVIGAKDIPGRNVMPLGVHDQPFLADGRVSYIGEPILLLVGPDRAVLDELTRAVKVNYKTLAPVLEAFDADCTPEHAKPDFASFSFTKGDPSGASSHIKPTLEEEFRTGYQEHAYLETQAMIGYVEDGTVTVSGSMQCPYMVKEAIVEALALLPDRVRVVQLPTGGAFGGKEEYPSIPGVHAALCAVKCGKPVKLVFERREDMICTTKRHPSSIRIKSWMDGDGRIMSRDIGVRLDAGAYSGLSSVVLQRLSFAACGAYDVPNLRVDARAIPTNNIVSGAFRGFGGPQAFFAAELHMEHLAQVMGIDSLELRKRNLIKQGDYSSTGGRFMNPVRLDEVMGAAVETSGYRSKKAFYSASSGVSRPMRGIGLSVFFHGCGFTGNGERDVLKARARLAKRPDRTVEVLVSSSEMGQGCQTTLRKIAAEALGIPLESVVQRLADTAACPDSGPTVASRTTMIVGRLIERCAIEMRRRWSERAFEVEMEYEYPAYLSWDNANLRGNAYPEYSWGANVVEVEVDPLTYEAKVQGIWGAYDIGTPIDELIVAGQIDGGVIQGLGYAGMEVMESYEGRLLQDNLTNYAIPTSLDYPKVMKRLIDNPYPEGPFGAKGLGELPLVGAAPAFAIAMEQAIGRRIHRLPVTPEYLMRLMEGGS